MKYNYYVGEDYRAVNIAGKWRATKYNPDKNNWLFIDDIEYNTSSEALDKIYSIIGQ